VIKSQRLEGQVAVLCQLSVLRKGVKQGDLGDERPLRKGEPFDGRLPVTLILVSRVIIGPCRPNLLITKGQVSVLCQLSILRKGVKKGAKQGDVGDERPLRKGEPFDGRLPVTPISVSRVISSEFADNA
jgi:hypothetical protein